MDVARIIPYVMSTIATLTLTILALVFALGTNGRDGVLGRIIDGNTIQLQRNIESVTRANERVVPGASGITKVLTVVR